MDDRRDDWRHGVDENLASLNAGQRVWEEEQKRLREQLEDFDRLVRGDADQDTDGLIARLHTLETAVRMLEAVVLRDRAGNPGLQGRVDKLEGKEKKQVERWKFYIALIGLLSAIAVSIISNLDHIEAFFHPHHEVKKPVRHKKPPPPPEPEEEPE